MSHSTASATPTGINRRTALKALGTSVSTIALLPLLSEQGALAFEAIQRTAAAPKLKALTAAQYATVDAFSDAIIPTDAHSPGARAARVADYIDLLLSESDEPLRNTWTMGLQALDTAATTKFKAPFVKLTAPQVQQLLTEISVNEAEPKTPVEQFFRTTKDATIRGYYTSEIGIHKDLQYKGNQYLPEFVGCQTEDGKDCPHCGQKAQA
ncbi:MAG: gluconate 2-dehydrogenase subunit 3 family protein [Luteitalea sp.]|nr:gluconate 2-dehydrogenase subunit 3 family protein [Acidobacteriota bacterium]